MYGFSTHYRPPDSYCSSRVVGGSDHQPYHAPEAPGSTATNPP